MDAEWYRHLLPFTGIVGTLVFNGSFLLDEMVIGRCTLWFVQLNDWRRSFKFGPFLIPNAAWSGWCVAVGE